MDTVKRKKLIVLTEATEDAPKGLMVIADDVCEEENVVEFELNNYFKSAQLDKVRVATSKETYHYNIWAKYGRQELLRTVQSIVG